MATPPQGLGEDVVPLFGTWRNIYAAVVIVNLLAMAFVFLFSRFRF